VRSDHHSAGPSLIVLSECPHEVTALNLHRMSLPAVPSSSTTSIRRSGAGSRAGSRRGDGELTEFRGRAPFDERCGRDREGSARLSGRTIS
jgi:hypothetical protein